MRTLSEAARSLGAGWGTVMFRIVLPNIRSAVISASFISLALVLGEYTVASLLARRNLQTAIFLVGQNNVKTAVGAGAGGAGARVRAAVPAVPGQLPHLPKGHLRDRDHRARARHRRRQGVTVELAGLRRSFGAVHALDGMQLAMSPGELVVLLGPSGCGKTTALRVLAGLEEADEGRIVVAGRDITQVPTNKRDMGMVFQAYSLFPHMTAQQNVEFGLRLRGVDGARAGGSAPPRTWSWSGSSAQADRYAHQMSGGQQQRVALARALAIRPQVLLLDEPLSALDAKVRVQLRDEIRRIQLEVGITTLFVTHDQEEALAVADRVGVMREGRIEQIAAPDEIYNRPTTQLRGGVHRLDQPARPGTSSGGVADVLGLPGAAAAGVAGERPGHRAGPAGGGAGHRRRRRPGCGDGGGDELPRGARPGAGPAARRHAGHRPAVRARGVGAGAGGPGHRRRCSRPRRWPPPVG